MEEITSRIPMDYKINKNGIIISREDIINILDKEGENYCYYYPNPCVWKKRVKDIIYKYFPDDGQEWKKDIYKIVDDICRSSS